MVRMIPVILLFALLPRMLFAAPDGSIVCVSDAHVVLNCHASEATDDCGNEPIQYEPSEGMCLDLLIDSIEATANPPRASVEFVAVADLLPELIQMALLPVLPVATFGGEPAGGLPPRFCARTFASVLSPRC